MCVAKAKVAVPVLRVQKQVSGGFRFLGLVFAVRGWGVGCRAGSASARLGFAEALRCCRAANDMYAVICGPQVDFVGQECLPRRNGEPPGVRWLHSGIALLVLFSWSCGFVGTLVCRV